MLVFFNRDIYQYHQKKIMEWVTDTCAPLLKLDIVKITYFERIYPNLYLDHKFLNDTGLTDKLKINTQVYTGYITVKMISCRV